MSSASYLNTSHLYETDNNDDITEISVNVDVGCDVIFTVSVNSRSGFLHTMASDLGINSSSSNNNTSSSSSSSSSATIKLDEFLRLSKFAPLINSASFTAYVLFLRGIENKIIDRDVLTGCLLIYNHTEDRNFFEWQLKQLFDHWTLLSPVLTDGEVPEDVVSDVWLRCPQQLLPKCYLNNTKFMDKWLNDKDNNNDNNNKKVILNEHETLSYQVMSTVNSVADQSSINQSGDEVSTYLTYLRVQPDDDDLLEIRSINRVNTYMSHTKRVYTFTTYNMNGHGLVTDKHHKQYKNPDGTPLDTEVITTIDVYYKDRKTGPQTAHRDGELKAVGYQDNNNFIGRYTYYYKSGNISTVKVYDNKGQQLYSDDYYDDHNNTLFRHVDFLDGKENFETIYLDDGEYAEVQKEPRVVKFFDANNVLRRRITDFDVSNQIKQDILYDEDGVTVISQIEFGPNWYFDHYYGTWDEITDDDDDEFEA